MRGWSRRRVLVECASLAGAVFLARGNANHNAGGDAGEKAGREAGEKAGGNRRAGGNGSDNASGTGRPGQSGTVATRPVDGPASKPFVHDRAAWGARRPRRQVTVLDAPPDHIVVHHTATPNTADRSLDHAFALSRAIQNHHMDRNGWNDIGQQLTISRGGHTMEGRARSLGAIASNDHVVGAHTASHNAHTIGIECEGRYTAAAIPDPLWEALCDVCTWLCARYRLNPYRAIVGHRDFNATACPGERLYRRLPLLRKRVATALGGAARVPPPAPAAPKTTPTEPYDHGPALGPRESG